MYECDDNLCPHILKYQDQLEELKLLNVEQRKEISNLDKVIKIAYNRFVTIRESGDAGNYDPCEVELALKEVLEK